MDSRKGCDAVPTAVKNLDSMTKHLTKSERTARQAAEDSVQPGSAISSSPPKSLAGDRNAQKAWRTIVRRMSGLDILEKLDTEVLAIYCSALSRRDALNALCRDLIAELSDVSDLDTKLERTDQLDSLCRKIAQQEKSLLQYAGQLGLTPEARARLARRRAAQDSPPDPDEDLFGD